MCWILRRTALVIKSPVNIWLQVHKNVIIFMTSITQKNVSHKYLKTKHLKKEKKKEVVVVVVAAAVAVVIVIVVVSISSSSSSGGRRRRCSDRHYICFMRNKEIYISQYSQVVPTTI